jgi:hypothetical protein
MLARVVGVFKLDVNTFEEIEHNASLTLYAAIIVGLVSLVSGVGRFFFSAFRAIFNHGNVFSGVFSTIFAMILGWLAWSIITWFVGTRFFKGQATIDEMLRVIGFAFLPLFLTIIPCVGPLIGGVWALIAGFIATRQGLDLDNTQTFLTVVVGWLGWAVLYGIATWIF